MDPDGRYVGWYIDNEGTVIGKDKNDDNRIYLVNNQGDVNKIKNDNYCNGVSQSDLKGDVVEVPSYEGRQHLKRIYDLGKKNLIDAGEFGMLIYSNNENKLGAVTYQAKKPIERNENGDIRGSLGFNVRERIDVCGPSDANTLRVVAHTHNVNDGKPHPPTLFKDHVPQGTIGIVFDYYRESSNTYIYDSNTQYRSRSYMPSSTFFQPFVTPSGKKL